MPQLIGTEKGEQVFRALLELSGIAGQLEGYLAAGSDNGMIPELLKDVQRRVTETKKALEDAYFGA